MDTDGSYVYTPPENFNGEDSVDYTLTDGSLTDIGTLTITVDPVNDAPVAVDDVIADVDEDTPVTLTVNDIVTTNDSDVDGDTLTISAVSNPVNGSVVLNVDGTVTFIPNANYNGPASFDYTISDGNGGTDSATVALNFSPVIDGPPIITIPDDNGAGAAGDQTLPETAGATSDSG